MAVKDVLNELFKHVAGVSHRTQADQEKLEMLSRALWRYEAEKERKKTAGEELPPRHSINERKGNPKKGEGDFRHCYIGQEEVLLKTLSEKGVTLEQLNTILDKISRWR